MYKRLRFWAAIALLFVGGACFISPTEAAGADSEAMDIERRGISRLPPVILVEASSVGEVGAEPWPGSNSVLAVDDPANAIGKNASGITYQPASITGMGVLWMVRNNPEMAHKMTLDPESGKWRNDDALGWGGGKALRLPRNSPENPDGNRAPDSEGLTKAEWDDEAIYVVSERMQRPQSGARQSILRYETNTEDLILYPTHEWVVSGTVPKVSSNGGFESLTWVPDSFLLANGFRDKHGKLYNPEDHPHHGTGLFFAGLEDNARIYVYALNQNDDTDFDLIVAFDSGLRPNIMGLEFDRDTGLLWAGCDDNCGSEICILALHKGAFRVEQRYAKPSTLEDLNNEGIAMFPEAECSGATKPFLWVRDNGGHGTSLFVDRISCQ